ncbi:MAG: hypothetical protein ABI678_30395, partial [Kofleriaceae bacterium]
VEPSGVFRIGTAAAVELPIAGVVEFPLVTAEQRGFVVRRPIGLATWHEAGDEVVLADPIVLALDRVTITIERIDREHAPVPRAAIDRRPHAFVAGSLLVHFLVWGAAIAFAAAPRAKRPRPRTRLHPVIARLEPRVPTSETSPYPARVAGVATAPARPRGHATRSLIGPDGRADFSAGLAALGEAVNIDWGAKMAETGPLVQADDVYHFGNDVAFDPDTRPGFETVKTGRFETVSSGRAVGEDYHLAGETTVQLALCDSPRCEITGALAKPAVQRVIQRQVAAVAGCVGDESLVLDLDIAADGRVKKVHGHGKVARCAAKVIGQLAFPVADGDTHAAFTIGYP